jgi:hypothetical protein
MRVGEGALKLRNPLPGIAEVRAPFGAIARRHPRFVVVSANWVQRYLRPELPLAEGRVYSNIQQRNFQDADARAFFADLHDGRLGYRLVHVSRFESAFWPAVHIHDSLDETIRIFERVR